MRHLNARTLYGLGFMVIMSLAIAPGAAIAQNDRAYPTEPVEFQRRNLSGPRLGVTMISGNQSLYDDLEDAGLGRVLSQFGWHFERQVIPDGGGPQFVLQLVILAGGVEFGTLVPSVTTAMGIRFPSGVEFGMGPNLVGTSSGPSSSLVLSVGKSIDYGGVSIPLNLAYATSPGGRRISLIVGYAIARL